MPTLSFAMAALPFRAVTCAPSFAAHVYFGLKPDHLSRDGQAGICDEDDWCADISLFAGKPDEASGIASEAEVSP